MIVESGNNTIAPFVTNTDRPVFALRGLPEEVVAVLFAYYSRSTEPLRDNLLKLLAEGDVAVSAGIHGDDEDALLAARDKARQFHEKWVVGYGHSSVAEHAVVHLALEDVSILASKVIEDARLASFTEKSTRYVVFDESKYYTPDVFREVPHVDVYSDTCRHLLGTYAKLMAPIIDAIKARRPRGEKQTERGWESACKASACDILRCLLPTSTRTNIGLTANARTLEYLIVKLLSNPLQECHALGEAMKTEAQKVTPTLIKYADRSAYLADTNSALDNLGGEWARPDRAETSNGVRLISSPENPEIDLAAALLYDHVGLDWTALRSRVSEMPPAGITGILNEGLRKAEDGGRRGKFDQPLRALEHLYYTFEITLDYGAYRDIQRHRMATQSRQRLTTTLGCEMPVEIEEFDLKPVFDECMERSASAYAALRDVDVDAAQYVLPMAWRVRVLFTWNLRELHHFISLRSGKQGHASYRRVAQDVWHALYAVHPTMADYIRVDMKDYALARA